MSILEKRIWFVIVVVLLVILGVVLFRGWLGSGRDVPVFQYELVVPEPEIPVPNVITEDDLIPLLLPNDWPYTMQEMEEMAIAQKMMGLHYILYPLPDIMMSGEAAFWMEKYIEWSVNQMPTERPEYYTKEDLLARPEYGLIEDFLDYDIYPITYGGTYGNIPYIDLGYMIYPVVVGGVNEDEYDLEVEQAKSLPKVGYRVIDSLFSREQLRAYITLEDTRTPGSRAHVRMDFDERGVMTRIGDPFIGTWD